MFFISSRPCALIGLCRFNAKVRHIIITYFKYWFHISWARFRLYVQKICTKKLFPSEFWQWGTSRRAKSSFNVYCHFLWKQTPFCTTAERGIINFYATIINQLCLSSFSESPSALEFDFFEFDWSFLTARLICNQFHRQTN